MSFIAAVLLLNIFGCMYKGCRLSPLCCVQGMSFIDVVYAVLLLNIFGCMYKGCRLSPLLCCYSISLVVGTRDVVYRRCVATQYLWL